jgi:hypothetical protein
MLRLASLGSRNPMVADGMSALYPVDDEIDGFREASSARRETAPHSGSYASGGATPQCAADRRPANGGLAQLGEHLLCKQGVVGSIPSSSTKEL